MQVSRGLFYEFDGSMLDRARARLDVFETEPLPEDSKLLDRSDVTVTPNTAGFLDLDEVGVKAVNFTLF